jgi:hypothetical protein
MAWLTFPVTLRLSNGEAVDTRLVAYRSDQLSVTGRANPRGAVGVWINGEDTEITVGGPSSWTRWSTFCNLERDPWLRSIGLTLESPLPPRRDASLDCQLVSGTSATITKKGLRSPSFVLTRTPSHACRRTSLKDLAELPIEVRPSAEDAWLGATLGGSISYDVRQGNGELGVTAQVGPSETLRELTGCEGPSKAAGVTWKASLRGNSQGAELYDEVLEITANCVDITVRCVAKAP